MQGAFKQGATYQELSGINERLGGKWKAGEIQNAIAYRDGTGRYQRQGPQPGAGFQIPSSGQQSLIEKGISYVADSPVGAYGIGAANALTLGGLDEVAGFIGGESAGQRAQFAKDYSRENSPIASVAGEVGGFAAASLVPGVAGAMQTIRGGARLAVFTAQEILTTTAYLAAQ